MPSYEYPTSINFTQGMDGMFVYLNSVTGDWFSKILLIAIYVIFATGFYFARRDLFGGLAVAGFVTFVISLLFWIAGIVSTGTFIFVIAIAIMSFASLWIGEGR